MRDGSDDMSVRRECVERISLLPMSEALIALGDVREKLIRRNKVIYKNNLISSDHMVDFTTNLTERKLRNV